MAREGANKYLTKAKKGKNDEFYTQLCDIERELKHYKEHFKNKVVYCNCDDPYESNFFKYFALNFNFLGLKKLIATSYFPSPVAGNRLPLFEIEGLKPEGKQPFKIEINEAKDLDNDGAFNLKDIELLLRQDVNAATPLTGDGDFRSEECIELLKEADIVVTNPPFSLFRDFVSQMIEYEKKFLVIGNINAITYKEIFKNIKENKAWLGINMGRGISGFIVPESYELYGTEARIDEEGNRIVSTNNCLWLTNMDNANRNEELILYKKYNVEEYPKYDNYDAINVNKTKEIPMDYKGVMGVPITFLHKFNPEQFEILWTTDRGGDGMIEDIKIPHNRYDAPVLKGKGIYKRILIKNKKLNS